MAQSTIPGTQITEETLDNFIHQALAEDVQDGDHTSLACIDPLDRSKAKLLVKDDCVLAGMEVAIRTFKIVDPSATLEIFKKDGKKKILCRLGRRNTRYL